MKPVLRAAAVLYAGSWLAAIPVALALFFVANAHGGHSLDAAQFAAARDPLQLVDFFFAYEALWPGLFACAVAGLLIWVPLRVWLGGISLSLLAEAPLREAAVRSTDSFTTLLKVLLMGVVLVGLTVLPFALVAAGLSSAVEDSARSSRALAQSVGTMLVIAAAGAAGGVWALARAWAVRSPEDGAWQAMRRAFTQVRLRPVFVITAAWAAVFAAMLVTWIALWLDVQLAEASWGLWLLALIIQQVAALLRSLCWAGRDWWLVGLTNRGPGTHPLSTRSDPA